MEGEGREELLEALSSYLMASLRSIAKPKLSRRRAVQSQNSRYPCII